MAYTSNPKLPRLRMQAVIRVRRGESIRAVARNLGYAHSTVSRWVARAPFDGREGIPTLRSQPKSHPRALAPEIVRAIVEERLRSKRCAEVIQAALARRDIVVSLSSVKRTLKRHELVPPRKWKRYRPPVARPSADAPGSLSQRWSYQTLLEAKQLFGFDFQVVQADNGPEFATWLKDMLKAKHIELRHSRVRQSNDNAHIERFNRTIQQELLGPKPLRKNVSQATLDTWLYYYNHDRLHLGINLQTPSEIVKKQPA